MQDEEKGRLAAAAIRLARECARNGDLTQAIAAFAEAIELDPKNGSAYLGRGYVYDDLGERAKAEADFAEARELGRDVE